MRADPSDSADSLGDVLRFMRVLWQLDHALQSRSKQMEATLGVTSPQRLAIRLLGRFPGASPGELARLLKLHPSTVTGILQRLEARGLVHRRADPLDGRRSTLHLSASGKRLDRSQAGTVEALVRRALARHAAEQVRVAREVITTLAEQLDSPAKARKRAS